MPYQGTKILSAYNTAMDEIATKILSPREPLTSHLSSWENSTSAQRQYYIQKATEDCRLVCDVIAPNDGKQLFEAMTAGDQEKANDEAMVDDVLKL